MTKARALAVEPPGGDRCPGVVRLHAAQDGWLARIRLPGGRMTARQLEAVAAVARLGNGVVELTSRANLQVRGLSAGAGERVAELLVEAGLLPSPMHDRVRNVVASPLAGRHPGSIAATDAIVSDIDRGLCADVLLARLPGRFLFAVDDGAGLTLGLGVDVRLTAERVSRHGRPAVAFVLGLAGKRTTLAASPGEAAGLALSTARTFMAVRADQGATALRIGDLVGGPAEVVRRLGGRICVGDASPPIGELAPGTTVQTDGHVAVTGLPPLGRVDPAALAGLAVLVREHGGELRLSTGRTLSVLDVERSRAGGVLGALDGFGLIASARSGWEGLSACAGLGACQKARLDVRAAAARRAVVRKGEAALEHWSACERRCGEPAEVGAAVFAEAGGVTIQQAVSRRTARTVGGALALLASPEPPP